MLGSIKGGANKWKWGAYGKHPVARDYFTIDSGSPVIKAFSDWVENGYKLLTSKAEDPLQPCSWRFWVKGSAKDAVACGLAKDSSDSVGRKYPFLIMGTGTMQAWEKNWHLLPRAFDHTWSQMEFLSARRFNEFCDLEDEVLGGRTPSCDWSAFEDSLEQIKNWEQRGLQEQVEKEHFMFPLNSVGAGNPVDAVYAIHRLLKGRKAPNAVFIGGTSQASYISVYNRAIKIDDFCRLWAVEKDGGMSFV